MDLLSLIGETTKRKGALLTQASRLAQHSKSQGTLEAKMQEEAKGLVKALRDGEIRWGEYSRTLVDRTLISALAAVYLGSWDSNPNSRMEQAFPVIVGDMMPPLKNFLDQTQGALESGVLMVGDKALDFADGDLFEDIYIPEGSEMEPMLETSGQINPKQQHRTTTWPGLYSRVKRYISSPTFSFYALGESLAKKDQGYKQMRRVAKKDPRTCPDCEQFERKGWQPIGTLPMPGKQCRCFDRCRCYVEYR
jgi:hypothetical protein